jgi:hypothetical protein
MQSRLFIRAANYLRAAAGIQQKGLSSKERALARIVEGALGFVVKNRTAIQRW